MTERDAEVMLEGAVFPWASVYREIRVERCVRRERELRRSDTEEQIRRCLNCPYSECVEKSTMDCVYRMEGELRDDNG